MRTYLKEIMPEEMRLKVCISCGVFRIMVNAEASEAEAFGESCAIGKPLGDGVSFYSYVQ